MNLLTQSHVSSFVGFLSAPFSWLMKNEYEGFTFFIIKKREKTLIVALVLMLITLCYCYSWLTQWFFQVRFYIINTMSGVSLHPQTLGGDARYSNKSFCPLQSLQVTKACHSERCLLITCLVPDGIVVGSLEVGASVRALQAGYLGCFTRTAIHLKNL